MSNNTNTVFGGITTNMHTNQISPNTITFQNLQFTDNVIMEDLKNSTENISSSLFDLIENLE